MLLFKFHNIYCFFNLINDKILIYEKNCTETIELHLFHKEKVILQKHLKHTENVILSGHGRDVAKEPLLSAKQQRDLGYADKRGQRHRRTLDKHWLLPRPFQQQDHLSFPEMVRHETQLDRHERTRRPQESPRLGFIQPALSHRWLPQHHTLQRFLPR